MTSMQDKNLVIGKYAMPKELLKNMKKQIVFAAYSASEGHIASALSILDILWVLYDKIMIPHSNPTNHKYSDRFVLSKGHASLALYVVLANKGYFEIDELATFCKYESRLGGHPDCNKVPGVEASTGSLGHGFPMAVGLALGAKIRHIDSRTFCLVGDGECNEGSIWEAALLAAHHQLSRLCCIVDSNHSTDRALNLGDLAAKFRAFGWDVIKISGHDHNAIEHALGDFPREHPLLIIAETIKGYGIKIMENEPAWHHRSPDAVELELILEELK